MNRFDSVKNQTFDLVVIGGGIIGCGIARDAALRGLKVALFEQDDFGSGTTAGSTRLIHGGLRYLEMLDFRLVRMDLREREILLKIAPHLVRPLEFVVPFYRSSLFYRLKLRAGMWLYDALSYDKSLLNHRFLSRADLLKLEPNLSADGLQGAAVYMDAQVAMPERLCLENALDAAAHGAQIFNYARVTGAIFDGSRIVGVRVACNCGLWIADCGRAESSVESEREMTVRARLVVNATGAWFERMAQALNETADAVRAASYTKPDESSAGKPFKKIRTTKGVHLALRQVNERALVLFSARDKRLFFVIPWLGYSWLGTTDTDFKGDPTDARADKADIEYLRASVKEFYPQLATGEIYFTNAGVRALVMNEGSESSVSRMHRIEQTRAGLLSVLGGKITGYRAIAEEATDAACELLKMKESCRTATLLLPGAHDLATARARLTADEKIGRIFSAETREHLLTLYGSRAVEILELALMDENLRAPLASGAPDIAAQVVFAVRQENCLRLTDFILRRTTLGFARDQGASAAESAATLMQSELGWTTTRKAAELAAYAAVIARSTATE